eukprot:m.135992 g.135992  ORF g.135992 m.135992 type:complete len:153 (+) comp29829_c0_seq5:1202-1660(+)
MHFCHYVKCNRMVLILLLLCVGVVVLLMFVFRSLCKVQSNGIGRTLDQIIAQQETTNGGATAGLETLEHTCLLMQDLTQLHNTAPNKTKYLQTLFDLKDSLSSHDFVNPFLSFARAYSCGNFTALREMIEDLFCRRTGCAGRTRTDFKCGSS